MDELKCDHKFLTMYTQQNTWEYAYMRGMLYGKRYTVINPVW